MLNVNEDALVCDFAEVYHIYDYRALPCKSVAVLACGLGNDSRIMTALSGHNATFSQMLLATIADCLRTLVWFQTKDGMDGTNRPPSLVEWLTGGQASTGYGFESGAAFDEEWAKLTKGGEG